MFNVQYIWMEGKYREHKASHHLLFIFDLILHNIWIEFPLWNSLDENWSIFRYFVLFFILFLFYLVSFSPSFEHIALAWLALHPTPIQIVRSPNISNLFERRDRKLFQNVLIVCCLSCSFSSHVSDCMKWFLCCSKFHELRSIDVHCSFHIFGFAKLHWFGWVHFGIWIHSNRICGIWVNHYSVC